MRSYTASAVTPLGKVLLICASLVDTAYDTVRLLLPISSDRGSQHNFLAITSRRAGAQLFPERDFGHVTNRHRNTFAMRDDHALEAGDVGDLPG